MVPYTDICESCFLFMIKDYKGTIYYYLTYYVTSSNGIVLIYDLYNQIAQLGININLIIYNDVLRQLLLFDFPNKQVIPIKNLKDILERMKDEDIFIVPETIHEFTNNFKNVKDKKIVNGFFASVNSFAPSIKLNNDYFLWTVHNEFHPELPTYDFRSFLNDDIKSQLFKNKKDQVAIYHGKSLINIPGLSEKEKEKYFDECQMKLQKVEELYIGKDIKTITRNYPSSKKELYQLLKESKILITFDPNTNLIREALKCNTPVYIVYPIYHWKDVGIFYDVSDYEKAKKELEEENKHFNFKKYNEEIKNNNDKLIKQQIEDILRYFFGKTKEDLEYRNKLQQINKKFIKKINYKKVLFYNGILQKRNFVIIRKIISPILKLFFSEKKYNKIRWKLLRNHILR